MLPGKVAAGTTTTARVAKGFGQGRMPRAAKPPLTLHLSSIHRVQLLRCPLARYAEAPQQAPATLHSVRSSLCLLRFVVPGLCLPRANPDAGGRNRARGVRVELGWEWEWGGEVGG